jgi:hypothetical protein
LLISPTANIVILVKVIEVHIEIESIFVFIYLTASDNMASKFSTVCDTITSLTVA